MKSIKLAFLFCLLIVLCVVLSGDPRASAEQQERENVQFFWAFGAVVKGEHGPKVMAITGDTTLKTGDRLKMLIEPRKKCYLYLIYHSSRDELRMLFPYHLQQFPAGYDTLKRYYIPQGDTWFELDEHTGSETFYLLASAQRLPELETLLDQYISAPLPRKPELTDKVLAGILRIKKQHRKLTTTAERPVPIGGSLRGMAEDEKAARLSIDTLAVEISADNFFSRTYTIDHR
jgi:hypothetical protein